MDQFKIVFDEILAAHGLTLDFASASMLLCYPTIGAARAAERRGTFPVPIRRAGKKMLVSAADVARFLVGLPVQSSLLRPAASAPLGRPTKSVLLQAKGLGFPNVREMRLAQRLNAVGQTDVAAGGE